MVNAQYFLEEDAVAILSVVSQVEDISMIGYRLRITRADERYVLSNLKGTSSRSGAVTRKAKTGELCSVSEKQTSIFGRATNIRCETDQHISIGEGGKAGVEERGEDVYDPIIDETHFAPSRSMRSKRFK